jgi:AraC-like DNA-binding protein
MTIPVFKTRNKTFAVDSTKPQKTAITLKKIGFHSLTHGHYPGIPLHASVLPGLSSIGFLDAKGEQDWGLEPHRNEGIEIVFLETGNMVFLTDDKKYMLKAGNLTITRPWQLHRLGDPNLGPGRLHWILIDVGIRRSHQPWKWPEWVILSSDEKKELTGILRRNEHPVWNSTIEIRRDFQELAEYVRQYDHKAIETRARPGLSSHTKLTLLINNILLHLLEALREQGKEENGNLATYRRTVEMFFSELKEKPEVCTAEWTLETMAQHCKMGTTKFSRCSHDIANVSPWEYLIGCRLDLAKRLLMQKPERKITDIAFDCVFNSSQYFATQFRRRFKCTPRTYRQEHA